jgi:hypothetical protein
LIGTVEVERAGLGVARRKVLESWKGPPAGSCLNLASTVDPLRGNLRLLLVGERYLLFGSERQTVKPPRLSPAPRDHATTRWAGFSCLFFVVGLI